jgi:hypothetical protein
VREARHDGFPGDGSLPVGWDDVSVADMRRSAPEPIPGLPRIKHTPGMADELLKELAPLLAEEGIDLGGGEIQDMATLQAALDRAVERRNMALFTPVGTARDHAVDVLRGVVSAVAAADSTRAAELLEAVAPESPQDETTTVAGCTGVGLGLLDSWLGGHDAHAPAALGERTRLPAGHWIGERAATDILALARRGRAFRSLDRVIARQGGRHVLYGTALALSAAVQGWSELTGVSVSELAQVHIR